MLTALNNPRPAMLAVFMLLGGSVAAAASPTITVSWRDKPPYHYLDNGVPKGFLLERTQAIFAAAGIATRLAPEPQKRIWANFSHGATNYCSFSWYRLPEREAVGQYTLPISIDPPHSVLVSGAALARVKTHATLAALLADQELTLGVVDGVSYGPELDAMIAHSANQMMRRTVDTTSMMRMLSVGRASIMLVDREDWEYVHRHEPILQSTTRLDFPDMPPGLKRYIVCSRDISPLVMDKINQAITATGGAVRSSHGTEEERKAHQRP
ncbi:transporter substrate-binding domain-containing protein [Rugamonas apoptosis]|uniref:Transporter substrate-binding domain-containing protein n=1 Tax=Rugamonas apoptosis TaxID=2758570 RepID=A0A7W2IK44_9BURK|nr:transporter substrate-binding domain-containing protein [Rugamonas apoptosis]MBA5687017.1 transporter substrate-binding domain-containing protein [Rugamonas apoptosis]